MTSYNIENTTVSCLIELPHHLHQRLWRHLEQHTDKDQDKTVIEALTQLFDQDDARQTVENHFNAHQQAQREGKQGA